MVSFQLRHNLLITGFIIVIVGAMWLVMELLTHSFVSLKNDKKIELTDNQTLSKEVSYLEKIDNFALQEFGVDQRLTHFVEAESYFNFKNSPALLIKPKVTTYDEFGNQDYILTSQRANYLDSGEIKFKGKVDVRSSSGVTHKMNTQELLVGTKTDELISNKQVTYLAQDANMVSQGMHMRTKDDKMKLIGDTKINQNSGQKILTKDLYIDQSDNQKHYYSDNKTTYLAKENTIYADGVDMDMRNEIVKLLGSTKILQNSGSQINTKNLVVDQSGGGEIYRTKDKINYKSSVANIDAVGMNYDALKQKIKLTGGVSGVYE